MGVGAGLCADHAVGVAVPVCWAHGDAVAGVGVGEAIHAGSHTAGCRILRKRTRLTVVLGHTIAIPISIEPHRTELRTSAIILKQPTGRQARSHTQPRQAISKLPTRTRRHTEPISIPIEIRIARADLNAKVRVSPFKHTGRAGGFALSGGVVGVGQTGAGGDAGVGCGLAE